MKILKLTIHNIASIKDAVIDFTTAPLGDAGLFLISGRTGAGKSTILDCICLALYDDTPRLKNNPARDNVRDVDAEVSVAANDTRQLLRKYSAEGLAELEFTGNNNVTYRATWSVSRARRKLSGRLQTTKRTLERLDTHHILDKKKEIDAEIALAVNLDFNQFCRTVMLAQGEFTKFLNSSDTDKAAILSKITGTEIYTLLGKRIFERFRSEDQAFARCKLAFDNLEMLSDEQRETKSNEVSELAAAVNALSAAYAENTAILTSLINKGKYESELERLTSQKDSLAQDFRQFLLGIRSLEKGKADLESQIQKTTQELSSFADRKEILAAPEIIISLIDRIEDLKIAAKKARLAISEQSAHKDSVLLPDCNRLKKESDEIAKSLQEAQSAATALTGQIDDLRLPELRAERDILMQSRIYLENLNISLDNYAKCLKESEYNKKSLKEAEAELDSLGRQLKDHEIPSVTAKAKLDALQENHDKLFASSEKILSKIRSSLQVGDTCPVCKSKIANQLPSDDSVAALIAESRRSVDEARKETDRIGKTIADIEAQMKVKGGEIKKLKKKVDNDAEFREAETKIKENCRKLGIGSDSIVIENIRNLYEFGIQNIATNLKYLTSELAEGEALEKELRKKNLDIKNLQGKADESNKALKDAELKVNACDTKIATLTSQIAAAADNIASLKSHMAEISANTVYRESLEDLAALKTIVRDDADTFKRLNESVTKLKADAERLADNIRANKQTAVHIKTYLPDIAENDDFEGVTAIPAAKLLNFCQSLAGELKACDELTASTSRQLAEVTAKFEAWVNNHPDEPLSTDDLAIRCRTLQEEIDIKNRAIGALQSELKRDDDSRDKKKKLFDEYKRQEKTLGKWKYLSDLFGDAEGKKFRKIAQSYILSELIHSANHYLGGFTERYRLAIEPGTFIIMVEDAWNGYTRRPASTISGGESFMVALSLALALSDLNTDFSVDILFIDEGFGSLSAEYLQSAISTLRTLHRKSGRRIGIISHVEELRERIPVQIDVESSPNSSSSTIHIIPRPNHPTPKDVIKDSSEGFPPPHIPN